MCARSGITAVTHPLVDIVVECSKGDFERLSIQQGSWALTSSEEHGRLLNVLQGKPHVISNGGTLSNSISTAALLGVDTSLMGLVGDDAYGQHFIDGLLKTGTSFVNSPVENGRTGSCISLVMQGSGERSLRTNLGVAGYFRATDLSIDLISRSEWLFVEAFFLGAGPHNQEAFNAALLTAKKVDTRVALSLSAESIVRTNRLQLLQVLSSVDLLFANAEEALALTQATDLEEAFKEMGTHVRGLVITDGENGAMIQASGQRFFIPAYPVLPVDATGAGDAFAGSYLAGLVLGLKPQLAASGSARVAAHVVSQKGARLGRGAYEAWKESTGVTA